MEESQVFVSSFLMFLWAFFVFYQMDMRDKPQRIEEMLHLVCQEFSHLVRRTAWHLFLAGWEQRTFGRWAGWTIGDNRISLVFMVQSLFAQSRLGFVFSSSLYLWNQHTLAHPTPVLPGYLPPLPDWSSQMGSRGGRWKGYWCPHIHTQTHTGIGSGAYLIKGSRTDRPQCAYKGRLSRSLSFSLPLLQTIKQTCRVHDVNPIFTTM